MLELIPAIGFLGFCSYVMIKNPMQKKSDNKICSHNELSEMMGEGVRISANVRLSVRQSNEHILMVAPSGSGKSRRFLMHNVHKTGLQDCSMVVTDPSGEIQKTILTPKKEYILNPFSNNTVGYNPLANCKNEFEVRKIASVILTNGMKSHTGNSTNSSQQDWVGLATPLLTSYMLMNYHTKKYNFADMIKNICTMPITSKIETNEDGKITKATHSIQLEIIQSDVQSAITEFQSFLQVMGAHQTLSSIRIVLNSCLQVFLDSSVRKIFTRPNLNISKLRKEECIIYLQIPEQHSDYFSPLTATFLTQMFDYVLTHDGYQIYVLLDEMANIGYIPSIGKLLSTARKHNVSIVGAIQSLTQLKSVYGELEGKEINELFKTLLVCGGLRDSASYISELLGVKEYREREQLRTRELMTADEIRRMDKDEILIICNNKRPVKDVMLPIMV